MGDTLMMLRYVPLLAQAGARVLAWVPPELARVVRAIPGVADVLGGDAAAPACDWHAPFLSLPHVFATTLETIPPPAAIVPDAASVARWAARLPACAGRRVGLCWAGAARQGNPAALAIDRRRSLPLAALAPLRGLSACNSSVCKRASRRRRCPRSSGRCTTRCRGSPISPIPPRSSPISMRWCRPIPRSPISRRRWAGACCCWTGSTIAGAGSPRVTTARGIRACASCASVGRATGRAWSRACARC